MLKLRVRQVKKLVAGSRCFPPYARDMAPFIYVFHTTTHQYVYVYVFFARILLPHLAKFLRWNPDLAFPFENVPYKSDYLSPSSFTSTRAQFSERSR